MWRFYDRPFTHQLSRIKKCNPAPIEFNLSYSKNNTSCILTSSSLKLLFYCDRVFGCQTCGLLGITFWATDTVYPEKSGLCQIFLTVPSRLKAKLRQGCELSDQAKRYACCARVNKREWPEPLNQLQGSLGESYESISLSIMHYLFWASGASMLLPSRFQRRCHSINELGLWQFFYLDFAFICQSNYLIFLVRAARNCLFV